jgi:hypothetical protein
MMRKVLVAAALGLLLPVAAAAQVAVGVRAGTLGLGGEASLALMPRLGLRGGIGLIPVEYSRDFGDVNYTVQLTSPLANAGIDLFPGAGGFRLGVGLLFFTKSTVLDAEHTGTVDIGDRTYQGSEVGTLTGDLDHGSMAPYGLIGWGGRSARGLSFFLDLGAAYMEEPNLTLTASGPAANSQQFRDDLERERQRAEEDARKYLRVWPILSLGLRLSM